MRFPEVHYRWEWELRCSPEELWPVVANTNRFDRDTGVPRLKQVITDQRLPSARLRFRQLQYGLPLEYVQEPYEWEYPYRYGVLRRYQVGPLETLQVRVRFDPSPEGGTHCIYRVWVRARTLIGFLGIPIQIGTIFARRFEKTFRSYDRMVASGKGLPPGDSRGELVPGGRERLDAVRQALLDEGANPDLLARLVETVERADSLELTRIRPYALADAWGASRRELLELCLLATRRGLLEFQWDLLCPLCRNARLTSDTLAGVQSNVHCDTCNIDFTVNFDRSVELTFSPNASIRVVDRNSYCIGGPIDTPHVAVQQFLPPGETRSVGTLLEPGRYRIRTLELAGGQYLRVEASGGLPEATFAASGAGWPNDEPVLSMSPYLTFANTTNAEQLFILERMAWTDDAATAAEVTVLQRFRDLFANEALRPGERISVGSLAVLFTDLRDSTRLYYEIGDAPAFGVVMDHFDVLREAIVAEDGSIVKTIGDSVMAVFRRPASALRAILNAQLALAQVQGGSRPLLLKAGLHYGPCIAVTLNDRLDYFGSTVNIASRFEGQSTGGDVVISREVHDDPEVAQMLHDPARRILIEPSDVMLRGFENRRFEVWLVALDSATLMQAGQRTSPDPADA